MPPPGGLKPKSLIAMIHVPALPGTPRSKLVPAAIARAAAEQARLYAKCGFDALMIENMHDAPYVLAPMDPAVTACMTAAAIAVRDAAPDLPLGIQVLACGNKEALAIAHAAGGSFIRAENFVFAHVADEGLLPAAEAGPLLRYRRSIDADGIAILADVKKKHASHALTGDIDLAEVCHAAEFFGADAVVVTGVRTGDPAKETDLSAARAATRLPVVVGSGVTPANVAAMFRHADAVIVGSSIKKGGYWANNPDPRRCDAFIAAAEKAR